MTKDQFYNIPISIYKNVYDNKGKVGSLGDLLNCEARKKMVEEFRAESDTEKRKQRKSQLPCGTISAKFDAERSSGSKYTPTGLICIDIDGKDNPSFDVATIKQMVCGVRQVLYCEYSCSGKGVYAIIPLISVDNFKRRFSALERVFKQRLGIAIDHCCQDITRLRYLSYDPHPYFNGDAEKFVGIDKDIENTMMFPQHSIADGYKREVIKPYLQQNGSPDDFTYSKAKSYVEEIERIGIDIATDYDTWLKVGFALHTLGDGGKSLYRRISNLWSGGTTSDKDIDKIWNSTRDDKGIGIGTFFDICKRAGVNPYKLSSPRMTDMFADIRSDELLIHDVIKDEPEYKETPNYDGSKEEKEDDDEV